MKVIFVGIHDKPGNELSYVSHRCRKLIDRIIDQLKFSCVKTNLYDCVGMPKGKLHKLYLAKKWHSVVDVNPVDVVVLLGKEVQEWFHKSDYFETINVAHPASVMGKVAEAKYVEHVVEQIKIEALA